MDEELGRAIALVTAFSAGETEDWTVLAGETMANDPVDVLREFCLIVTHLADMIAEQAGSDWTVATVLQHLALDAEEGDGGALA